MEKPSKHAVSSEKRHGGDGASLDDRSPSSPRSKLKDKKPHPAERRYKDMLNTTSHIYQTQAPSNVTNTAEESHVLNQNAQSHTKDTAREVKAFSTDGILTEEIATNVPLTEIMPKPTSVMNLEVSSDSGDSENKSQNTVSIGKVPEESSAQQRVMENSITDHVDDDEYFRKGGSVCRKHASAHTDSMPKTLIGRPKLCESCAVSMLSYIGMLQEVLNEVAQDITSQEDHAVHCADCIKERVMQKNQIKASANIDHPSGKDVSQRPHDLPLSKRRERTAQLPVVDGAAPSRGAQQQSYQLNGTSLDRGAQQQSYQLNGRSLDLQRQQSPQKLDSTQRDSRTGTSERLPENQSAWSEIRKQVDKSERTDFDGENVHILSDQNGGTTRLTDLLGEENGPQQRGTGGVFHFEKSQAPPKHPVESLVMDHSETPAYISNQNDTFFGDTFKSSGQVFPSHPGTSDQPPSWKQQGSLDDGGKEVVHREDFHPQPSPYLREGVDSDGILSVLSNKEREVYDSARGGAGWETLTDSQDYRDTSFGPSSAEEAFVTMATTNAEAISCLVLGSSLLLCQTTRILCVLVTDGVSPKLRAPLASVFQVVQSVRSLDTVGTTKVALLDQPELGIFFRKLHVWRLVQFSKCVFLNPDTLVIQNSDELFFHEELSAVPDIGWPDCFNSGVFVFQPSVETFWKLVEFAESEGNHDGGDQGLLNSFFKDWSKDIHKKLSFIYNLMANVSYTYTPAFRQFGRNVKIVQFQGPFKPWHVKFYSGTGQISPSTVVHPTYVQFVHVWLNIFRVRVLPLLPEDIQSFASSQKIISASEILKFYPSPIEMEVDFLLTPPSVRLRPDPVGIPKQPSIMRRHSIGSAKELRDQPTFETEDTKKDITTKETPKEDNADATLAPGGGTALEANDSPKTEESLQTTGEEEQSAAENQEVGAIQTDAPAEGPEDDESRRSSIPGSEIGDYQGMAAWEQGRMDYMGTACSENIIKRLHFLMDKPGDSEKPE